MKKLCYWLVGVILCATASSVCAAEVSSTYTSDFLTVQGTGGWYICEFDGEAYTELVWDSSKNRWKSSDDTYPVFQTANMLPGNDKDVGYVFVCPSKGMVQLKGSVSRSTANAGYIYAIIEKNKKELWREKTNGVANYDLTPFPVKAGDVIKFRVNAEASNSNDFTWWRPAVEYLNMEYVPEADGFLYYQKAADGTMKELALEQKTEGYTADDGLAFINPDKVFPTEEYSMVRRYVAKEDGRHRVYAYFKPTDRRSGGNVVRILRNNVEIWRQIIPKGEESTVDVRAYCLKDDKIDIEVSIYDYTGFNLTEWECEVSKFLTPVACKGSTSVGFSNTETKKFTLGSLIGEGTSGSARCYSIRRDMEYPMEYDSASGRWKSTADDYGYVSSTDAMPGKGATTCIDYKVTDTGIVRIAGDMNISTSSDGVLAKIYKNGELIWSSRVGEERSVRWDEPYDVSYFSHYCNVVADVSAGDTLTFTYDKWRNIKNDKVDLKNIEISYIGGTILSDTTKWKLSNSVLINTETEMMKAYGEDKRVGIVMIDDSVYIEADAADKVIGDNNEIYGIESDGKTYMPLRKLAESLGKTVIWTDDKLVIIHEGIPVMYGYSELSEIALALKGGDLFE